jgi:SAM-dependent methyltransferase
MEHIYGGYAPIYDAIAQGRFSASMAEQALRWLSERDRRPARVLDLACGTGEAALVFAAAGCQVVGVDRSEPMLDIARGKARDAGAQVTFVAADIRDLPIGDRRRPTTEAHNIGRWSAIGGRSSFELVTCFYDSLNYLTEDGDLERVFAGVAEALRPGGRVMFDINTEAEYATWRERDVVTHDGRDILVFNHLRYDPAARAATGRIVWFVREIDRWWRGEETHVERAWSDGEVRGALAGARLALEARLDAEWRAAAAEAARVVYLARRLSEEAPE